MEWCHAFPNEELPSGHCIVLIWCCFRRSHARIHTFCAARFWLSGFDFSAFTEARGLSSSTGHGVSIMKQQTSTTETSPRRYVLRPQRIARRRFAAANQRTGHHPPIDLSSIISHSSRYGDETIRLNSLSVAITFLGRCGGKHEIVLLILADG